MSNHFNTFSTTTHITSTYCTFKTKLSSFYDICKEMSISLPFVSRIFHAYLVSTTHFIKEMSNYECKHLCNEQKIELKKWHTTTRTTTCIILEIVHNDFFLNSQIQFVRYLVLQITTTIFHPFFLMAK